MRRGGFGSKPNPKGEGGYWMWFKKVGRETFRQMKKEEYQEANEDHRKFITGLWQAVRDNRQELERVMKIPKAPYEPPPSSSGIVERRRNRRGGATGPGRIATFKRKTDHELEILRKKQFEFLEPKLRILMKKEDRENSPDDLLRNVQFFFLVVNEYTSNKEGTRVSPAEVTLLLFSLSRGMTKILSNVVVYQEDAVTDKDNLNDEEYNVLLENYDRTGLGNSRYINRCEDPKGHDVVSLSQMTRHLLQELCCHRARNIPIMFTERNFNQAAGMLYTMFSSNWEKMENRFCFIEDQFRMYSRVRTTPNSDMHPIRDYGNLEPVHTCSFHKHIRREMKTDKECTLRTAVIDLQYLFKDLHDSRVLSMDRFDHERHYSLPTHHSNNWEADGPQIEWGGDYDEEPNGLEVEEELMRRLRTSPVTESSDEDDEDFGVPGQRMDDDYDHHNGSTSSLHGFDDPQGREGSENSRGYGNRSMVGGGGGYGRQEERGGGYSRSENSEGNGARSEVGRDERHQEERIGGGGFHYDRSSTEGIKTWDDLKRRARHYSGLSGGSSRNDSEVGRAPPRDLSPVFARSDDQRPFGGGSNRSSVVNGRSREHDDARPAQRRRAASPTQSEMGRDDERRSEIGRERQPPEERRGVFSRPAAKVFGARPVQPQQTRSVFSNLQPPQPLQQQQPQRDRRRDRGNVEELYGTEMEDEIPSSSRYARGRGPSSREDRGGHVQWPERQTDRHSWGEGAGEKRRENRLAPEFGASYRESSGRAPLQVPDTWTPRQPSPPPARPEPKPLTAEEIKEQEEDDEISRTVNFLRIGSFDAHVQMLIGNRNPRVTPDFRVKYWAASTESLGQGMSSEKEDRLFDERNERRN